MYVYMHSKTHEYIDKHKTEQTLNWIHLCQDLTYTYLDIEKPSHILSHNKIRGELRPGKPNGLRFLWVQKIFKFNFQKIKSMESIEIMSILFFFLNWLFPASGSTSHSQRQWMIFQDCNSNWENQFHFHYLHMNF